MEPSPTKQDLQQQLQRCQTQKRRLEIILGFTFLLMALGLVLPTLLCRSTPLIVGNPTIAQDIDNAHEPDVAVTLKSGVNSTQVNGRRKRSIYARRKARRSANARADDSSDEGLTCSTRYQSTQNCKRVFVILCNNPSNSPQQMNIIQDDLTLISGIPKYLGCSEKPSLVNHSAQGCRRVPFIVCPDL